MFLSCIVIPISGQNWSKLIRLTWNAGWSMWPSIAADSGSGIHVVWLDSSLSVRDLFYKQSLDLGESWSSPIRLTWNANWPELPSIKADSSSGLHVVWESYTPLLNHRKIFYKRSADGGITWTQTSQITYTAGDSRSPSLAVDTGNGLHVVRQDDTPGNDEIFYIHSTDSGATWIGTTRLTWNAGESCNPSIAVDPGGGIHVVWQDDSPGNEEIFYKHSTDGGATWSGITRLSWNPRESRNPHITADSSSRIHVVWDNVLLTKCEILYKSSTDGGETWSVLTRLTWNGGSSFPSITADQSNGIHVVWINLFKSNWEIFYKHSTNSGISWSRTTRLTWNPGDSFYPAIAADPGGGIHVVWHDDTPGNGEIFYKNRHD